MAVIWEKRIEIGDDQLAEKLHEMRKKIALLEQIIVTTTVARIRSHVERKYVPLFQVTSASHAV